MTEGRTTDGILIAVANAERLRRRRLLVRLLLRMVPAAAGGLLITAAIVRFAHAPLAAFWIVFAALVAGVVVFAWLKGRVPAVTDAAATQLDADAALDGELRSAHWFASHSVSDRWTDYHLAGATERVEAVSWPSVYPPVKTARAWAGSMALALSAIALVLTSAWPAARDAAVTGGTDSSGTAVAGQRIPGDLQKQIDELLKALQRGAIPMDAARAKVGQLRDALADLDPKTQAALAKAMQEQSKKAGSPESSSKEDPQAADLASRAEKAAAAPSLPQDMKWSMEDLAAKLKNAGRPKEQHENEETQTTKSPGANDAKDAKAGEKPDAGAQMTRVTAADSQSTQMLATTASPMGAEARGEDGEKSQSKNDPLNLSGALRKETIEADTDSQGANVLAEMRKKSEKSRSTLAFTRVAPLAAYDKSHAPPPPPSSDALRPLVKQYFIRR